MCSSDLVKQAVRVLAVFANKPTLTGSAETIMWVLRALGWGLLFAGIAVLVDDSITALQAGSFRLVAAGELWYRLDAGSLNLLQSVIQRYVSVWAWDTVFVPILLAPAVVVLFVPALVLLFLTRKPKRQRIF